MRGVSRLIYNIKITVMIVRAYVNCIESWLSLSECLDALTHSLTLCRLAGRIWQVRIFGFDRRNKIPNDDGLSCEQCRFAL